MKYLILLITLVTLANIAYGHDHGGEIARECLNDGLIEADYITETRGIVRCYVDGMEMMGSRHAVTPGGSCSLIQMLGKKVEMRYDFIDNGEHASAFDDAYECFKSALR